MKRRRIPKEVITALEHQTPEIDEWLTKYRNGDIPGPITNMLCLIIRGLLRDRRDLDAAVKKDGYAPVREKEEKKGSSYVMLGNIVDQHHENIKHLMQVCTMMEERMNKLEDTVDQILGVEGD